MEYWRAPREFPGETVFILGGGPSVLTQNLELLRGRRLIAINSSFEAAPWADYVICADGRWFEHNRKKLATVFKGKIVTTSTVVKGPPRLYRLHKKSPPGLAEDPGVVSVRFTTLSAAMNLAVHLGANRLILLGIDGKKSADGRTHHHAPHPWRQIQGCWEKQRGDLVKITEELKAKNIECLNASPDSVWDLWPKVKFEDYVSPQLQCA